MLCIIALFEYLCIDNTKRTQNKGHYEQYIFKETAVTGFCNNTVIVAAVRTACVPIAAHINLLLSQWRSTLHH
jgi:hypothetical protein